VRQPEDFVNRVSRELYACKTMKEHIDSALPYVRSSPLCVCVCVVRAYVCVAWLKV
jgi:hypothetical protein